MEVVKTDNKKNIAQTTNKIAFLVLSIFSTLLLVVLIKAILSEDANTIWFSAFKDGFLLLGGAFTTLIGYYFGSRGGDLAISEAERKEQKAAQIEKQFENIAPTSTENTEGMNQIKF